MKAKSIHELVNIALNKSSNIHSEIVIGRISIKQAKILKQIIGENIVGSERVLTTEAVRHTLNNHGNEIREIKRGQIAVTVDDFGKIPMILKEPDSIEYAGKNNLRQNVFYYKKKIGVIYVAAEFVRFAKTGTKLVFATMFKIKK